MKSEKEIGKIIRELRGNLSLREFGKICDISHTTIDNLEKGIDFRTNKPTQVTINTLEKIAKATNVSVSYIIGEQNKKTGIKIPVYSHVAAGIPINAIEDIVDYEEIDEELANAGEYFGVIVKGDSMEPRMTTGDVVIVRSQQTAETGDIAIVMIEHDNATCKKIKKTPEGIMLISLNPTYEPMFYSNKEIERLPVRILGKVVELRAKF